MFEILFENADLIAVNKPEGLAAIPEQNPQEPSLFEKLCAQRSEKLYIIHRIDKDTSGVIIFARKPTPTAISCPPVRAAHDAEGVSGLVHGFVAAEQGIIDKPLSQFGSGRVGVSPSTAAPLVTEYLVLHRFAAYTLLEAYPKTGRRHQIRVHLYSIGHAIVGDRRYGDLHLQRQYPRMMLHAQKLTIRPPSGEELTIEAPMPQSFTRRGRFAGRG